MMSSEYSIIKAETKHAVDICNVLIRSINEVCVADHHNDAVILESWLSNKNPSNLEKWIMNNSNYTLVALEHQNKVIGVSMISKEGEILLNYLLPEYLKKGIGKAMLLAMESFAKKQGIMEIRALSTITAAPFYEMNDFKVLKDQTIDISNNIPLIKALNLG